MTYDDPFADQSPWDEPTTTAPTSTEETPLTSTAPNTPAPFKIGFTLKAGSGFESEWITPAVYGHSGEETAARGAELLAAMKAVGLIDLTAKAAQYTREQYKGGAASATPKRFENGKVVAPNAGSSDYTCDHGQRNFKDGGSWAAYFCGGRGLEKPDQCPPLWRQKDGSFRAK
ncbi:hypothetical protein AB0M57_35350 [Streptomyces sp. NPDC051597]|uniref:hypothetical protein n=1 Tax=Streptomyces sp. NPDC051597 TaxID=3155049 RepID=UPI0034427A79